MVRTKDRSDFLARALADISQQTFNEWRTIIVNDGGDRAGVEAIVAASAIGDRCEVLDTAAPGGRCVAANLGVRASNSEYVVLHDDDDMWHADFLLDTVAWLDVHPTAAGVSAATEIHYEERVAGRWSVVERVRFWADMQRISLSEMVETNRIVPISFLYRRALHEEIGWYDVTLDAVEDWDFYLRVMRRHPIGYLGGEPRAFWTQRPTTYGAAANSIFALASEHARDDAVVRDRALSKWVAENGLAVPLYVGSVEKRLRHEFATELSVQLEQQRHQIVATMYEQHPVWRRLRSLRARLTGSRGSDTP